ncbi:uncharacterized protein EV422DRAFT_143990 [Fimicolochytrium jonesii]|uniref:uncharacterized protein n=1 Tax=Fimicolochytrium jonesii TaxID=1396493 RepID=UPI0022FEFACE|nr:uncharacterized protein EV422DRAFT_143990 [Fimicolochytrium jonesii]KAI8825864.1 hypothetical protein EV422DRAFT_143990 [Fimicolochytrium jonesii]
MFLLPSKRLATCVPKFLESTFSGTDAKIDSRLWQELRAEEVHAGSTGACALRGKPSVVGDHYGAAKGRNVLPVSTGEIENNKGPDLDVEDYLGNPSAPIPQGLDRDGFTDGLTKPLANKVEFGNHFNNGKLPIGEDANRGAAIRVREDSSVEGRLNGSLRRDNPNNDGLAIESQLRADAGQIGARPMVQRTQPLQVVTDRMPVVIKTKNVEAVNPRLDPTTRITTDLYPWIKEKS